MLDTVSCRCFEGWQPAVKNRRLLHAYCSRNSPIYTYGNHLRYQLARTLTERSIGVATVTSQSTPACIKGLRLVVHQHDSSCHDEGYDVDVIEAGTNDDGVL